jgi:hypothetical protein
VCRRIELIPGEESEEKIITEPFVDSRYVNSESFRGAPTPSSSLSRPEPRPIFLQDDRETLLGAEIDPNYRRTLIKFLPDY